MPTRNVRSSATGSTVEESGVGERLILAVT